MLEAGAAAYLTKGASLEEMIKIIHQVASGERDLDLDLTQPSPLNERVGSKASLFDSLSSRELSIMKMIATGMRVKEISEKLAINAKTVNTHRYNIYEKLGLENDVQLASLVFRHRVLEQEST